MNLKNFTADSPTATTVDSFLHVLWGYDTNRIWRVEAVEKTASPGVSKVVVYVDEKGATNARPQAVTFFVMPDGKHAIAGEMTDFGATPFADRRAMLQAAADGPFLGSQNKDLELVEFADLQCPHCKEAQGVMKQLEHDFPTAHIVYQNFPLEAIHPAAFEAAADGVCVAKHGSAAFFTYADAVFATQEQLTPDATQRDAGGGDRQGRAGSGRHRGLRGDRGHQGQRQRLGEARCGCGHRLDADAGGQRPPAAAGRDPVRDARRT